jgi:hypothetical protein
VTKWRIDASTEQRSDRGLGDPAVLSPLSATSTAAVLSVDPTNHGSNLPVVAALAVGILVLIGLLVVLITRRDRRR